MAFAVIGGGRKKASVVEINLQREAAFLGVKLGLEVLFVLLIDKAIELDQVLLDRAVQTPEMLLDRTVEQGPCLVGSFGVAWFAGSAIMGLLYAKSIPALIIFSVVLQLLALPLFVFANKEKAESDSLIR